MSWSDRGSLLEMPDPMEQPCLTRCLLCQWSFEGMAKHGRDLHREHRKQAHGLTDKKRTKHRSPIVQDTDPNENLRKVRAAGGGQGKPPAFFCAVEGCDMPSLNLRNGFTKGLCHEHALKARRERQREREAA